MLLSYLRSLLEQTFGASLVRGDFEGDVGRWSRRWGMGEEYIRIRPFLVEAYMILDMHSTKRRLRFALKRGY